MKFFPVSAMGLLLLLYGIGNYRRRKPADLSTQALMFLVLVPNFVPLLAIIALPPWYFSSLSGGIFLTTLAGMVVFLITMPKGHYWQGIPEDVFRRSIESGMITLGIPVEEGPSGNYLLPGKKVMKVRYSRWRSAAGLDNLSKVMGKEEYRKLVQEVNRCLEAETFEVQVGIFKVQVALGIAFLGLGACRVFFDF